MDSSLNTSLPMEDDLFYFESDNLALKGNKDYSEVLKTVLLLSIHRKKAIKDYNKVCEIKKQAIEDPLLVFNKIKNGDDLGVPAILDLPKLPEINFKKYNVEVPDEELKLIYANVDNSSEVTEKSESRKNTNQWTSEEQKRLEELLVIYPPEAVEVQRFKKIAKALGTRSVKQVASRVQKYFLKLYRAGLPIPGRIPKACEKVKKNSLHRHQRNNHFLWKPTTFFPELNIPVKLNELENIPGPSISSSPSASTSSSTPSNYLIPSTYNKIDTSSKSQKSDSELHLELLKRIKMEKLKEQSGAPFYHIGFRCDYCNESPIIGTRWHCSVCSDSVDFCTDCVLSQLYSEKSHPLSHKLLSFVDDSEYPASETSDSENNFDNGISPSESEENSKTDSQDVNCLVEQKVNSDDEFVIKTEEMDNEYQNTENLPYSYLHADLMFDENE